MTRKAKDANALQANQFAKMLGMSMSELRFLARDAGWADMRPGTWISPIDQARLRGARANIPDILADVEHAWVSFCPVCFDPIDYCTGHGEIGDPAGHALMQELDYYDGE